MLLLFLFFISGSLAFSQKIDSLKTDGEVLDFVRSIDSVHKNVFIVRPKPVSDEDFYNEQGKKNRIVAWQKADFDNNGRIDLLFNGFFDGYAGNHFCTIISFVVLAYGTDSFQIKELNKEIFSHYFSATGLVINGRNYIKVIDYVSTRTADTLVKKTDTLMYAFDNFIEKSEPRDYNIEKIEFCAFGGGPFFETRKLAITQDSIIMLKLKFPKDGNFFVETFRCKMDSTTGSNIYGILKQIDFPHLKENYAVGWTDDIVGDLKITYNKGKIKKITDYGLIGTYGLAALQEIFIDMEKDQHWEKVNQVEELLFCDPD